MYVVVASSQAHGHTKLWPWYTVYRVHEATVPAAEPGADGPTESLGDRGLGLFDDRIKCGGVEDGQLRERLTIKFDPGLVEAVDELAVA